MTILYESRAITSNPGIDLHALTAAESTACIVRDPLEMDDSLGSFE